MLGTKSHMTWSASVRNDAEAVGLIIKLFQLPANSQVCFQKYLTLELSKLLMLFLNKFAFLF